MSLGQPKQWIPLPNATEILLRERIQRGAEVLDKVYPGWEDEIRLKNLDVRHQERCVLAQLYGDYSLGVTRLGLDLADKYGEGPWTQQDFVYSPGCGFWAIHHGFYCTMKENYELATTLWTEVIKQRRAA